MGRRAWIVLTAALVSVIGVMFFMAPIPQWPGYHDFADQRTIAGIPNAADALSNLLILLVGAWGTVYVLTGPGVRATAGLQPCYLAFFAGFAITGLGAIHYHLAPDNASLIWARLPITVVFMGLLSAVIGELASPRAARALLMPLLAVGAGSVAWWVMTEHTGQGDVRPYVLVTTLPVLLIALMLVLYRRPRSLVAGLAGLTGFYALAKLSELYDGELFELTGFVSGITLKHLFAATGAACLLLMLRSREKSRAAG